MIAIELKLVTQKELDAFKTLLWVIEGAYNEVVTSKEMKTLRDANIDQEIGTWAIETEQMIRRVWGYVMNVDE